MAGPGSARRGVLIGRARGAAGAAALGLLAALLQAPAAGAHPHIIIEYAVIVHFAEAGPQAVEFSWTFDDLSSAMILHSFDTDRDGTLSAREVGVIEQKHFGNLKDYHYFVEVKLDGTPMPVTVKGFRATVPRSRVIYRFTVPIVGAPVPGRLDITVDDPTFYTAFVADERGAVKVEGAQRWRAKCGVVRDKAGARPDTIACTYGRVGR